MSELSLSEIDLAYIAGIVDGEGTIKITKSQGYIKIAVQIYNVNEQLLNWLADIIGFGKVYLRKTLPNRKPQYVYCIQVAFEVKIFLESILNYLRVKKNHAKVVLEFYNYHYSRLGRKRADDYEKELWGIVKNFNKRG